MPQGSAALRLFALPQGSAALRLLHDDVPDGRQAYFELS
jgi:hypothetical protein